MLQRVPLSSPEEAIQAIEKDGGVILTGFSSITAVTQVNGDIDPFMQEKVGDVKNPV